MQKKSLLLFVCWDYVLTSSTLRLPRPLFLSLASLRGATEPYLASVDKQGKHKHPDKNVSTHSCIAQLPHRQQGDPGLSREKGLRNALTLVRGLKRTRRATLSHGEEHRRSSLLFCCGRLTSLSAHPSTSNHRLHRRLAPLV